MNVVRTAFSASALRRTLPAALVVGSILTVVNSGPRLARGNVDVWLVVRLVLTISVPWLNATYGYVVGRRQIDGEDHTDRVLTRAEAA